LGGPRQRGARNGRAKEAMLKIAENYEQIAKRAEA
jgi:hypothetical protein